MGKMVKHQVEVGNKTFCGRMVETNGTGNDCKACARVEASRKLWAGEPGIRQAESTPVAPVEVRAKHGYGRSAMLCGEDMNAPGTSTMAYVTCQDCKNALIIRAASGEIITDGMAVWDYDLHVGTVDLSDLTSDGWFHVNGPDGVRVSLMNGERVTTCHPFSRVLATDALAAIRQTADEIEVRETARAEAVEAAIPTVGDWIHNEGSGTSGRVTNINKHGRLVIDWRDGNHTAQHWDSLAGSGFENMGQGPGVAELMTYGAVEAPGRVNAIPSVVKVGRANPLAGDLVIGLPTGDELAGFRGASPVFGEERKQEIRMYLENSGELESDWDVEGLSDAVREEFGNVSIDAVPADRWNDLLFAHVVSRWVDRLLLSKPNRTKVNRRARKVAKRSNKHKSTKASRSRTGGC